MGNNKNDELKIENNIYLDCEDNGISNLGFVRGNRVYEITGKKFVSKRDPKKRTEWTKK